MCPLYPLHIVLLYLCLILPLLLAVVQGSEELSGSILGASKGSLTFGAHYNGTYLNLDNLRTQEQNVSELEVSNAGACCHVQLCLLGDKANDYVIGFQIQQK